METEELKQKIETLERKVKYLIEKTMDPPKFKKGDKVKRFGFDPVWVISNEQPTNLHLSDFIGPVRYFKIEEWYNEHYVCIYFMHLDGDDSIRREEWENHLELVESAPTE